MRFFSLLVLYAALPLDLYFWSKSCVLYSNFYGRRSPGMEPWGTRQMMETWNEELSWYTTWIVLSNWTTGERHHTDQSDAQDETSEGDGWPCQRQLSDQVNTEETFPSSAAIVNLGDSSLGDVVLMVGWLYLWHQVLDLATPEVDLVVVISQDSLPAKDGHLSQGSVKWPGIEPTTTSRKSNVPTTRCVWFKKVLTK